MKLELKHIAPYLPYGLKCHCSGLVIDYYADEPVVPIMVEIVGAGKSVEIHEVNRTVTETYFYEDIFPILRPLSDVTKEIEIAGEKFTPVDFGCGILSAELKELSNNEISQPYLYARGITLNKLFEWHFDVFGLIEKGLAIDINTLEGPQERK